MKTRKQLLFVCLLLMGYNLYAEPPSDEGKNIFLTRCAACHNPTRVLTGPALAGVEEKMGIEWIIKFVQSSQTVIKSGDTSAIAIFEKFNKVPMPDHPDLTPENIKSIFSYIKSESQAGLSDKNGIVIMTKRQPNYQPFSFKKDYHFFIGYFIVVIMLVLALLFAVQSNSFQRSMRG